MANNTRLVTPLILKRGERAQEREIFLKEIGVCAFTPVNS